MAKLILLYAEKYVTNEKMIKLAGPNEQYTIKTFKGEDIQTKHDVIVVRGSLAPASSAVRRNDIVNAWQSGLYGMPQDPMVIQKVFKSLEFGDVDGAWEDQALDEAQIKYTLQQIDDGLAPDVHELDNHPLHIAAKNRFRKTDKYRAYDTHRQALILADIEEHLRFMTGFMAAGQGQPPDPNVRAQNQSQGIIAELSTAKNNTAENQLRNETMNQSQSLMGAQPGGQ